MVEVCLNINYRTVLLSNVISPRFGLCTNIYVLPMEGYCSAILTVQAQNRRPQWAFSGLVEQTTRVTQFGVKGLLMEDRKEERG